MLKKILTKLSHFYQNMKTNYEHIAFHQKDLFRHPKEFLENAKSGRFFFANRKNTFSHHFHEK